MKKLLIELRNNYDSKSFEWKINNHHIFSASNRDSIHKLINISNSLELEQYINGTVLDKWFVLELLKYIEEIDDSLLYKIATSYLGFNTSFRILDSLFENLVRIFGYPKVVLYYIDKIANSKTNIEKYFYFDHLRIINFQDLVTYHLGELKIDGKATYEWTKSEYILRYKQEPIQILKFYQEEMNFIHFKISELVLNFYIENHNDVVLKEICRFLFPRKENCPLNLIDLYHKALNIG